MAELNQNYQSILKEAEAHVSAYTDQTDTINPTINAAPSDPGPRIERPQYRCVRLLGDRCVAELAQSYLPYPSDRLRPGSHKTIYLTARR